MRRSELNKFRKTTTDKKKEHIVFIQVNLKNSPRNIYTCKNQTMIYRISEFKSLRQGNIKCSIRL